MNSADKIKQFFKDAELSINSDADEKIFQDVFDARQKAKEKAPARPVNIGRIIMKNSITKFAAAAMIAIVCLTGLIMLSTTSSVALADVLNQIERISTYMYQMDMTTQGQIIANRSVNVKMHGTTLFSHEYGQKTTMDMNDLNRSITTRQELYVIPKDKILIQIMPDQKTYMRMEVDDDYVERIKDQSYDPGKIIGQVLSCKYNSLGISTIDGKTVEGFQTNDPNYAGGMYSTVDIILWVDAKTQLPVRMEMDLQMEGPTNTSISGVIHNFQWNISVDASEFEPVIPDDYTSATSGSIKMPSNTEDAAIEGLKLYADFFGNYPKEMNLVTLISQLSKITDGNTPAAIEFQEGLNGLNQAEKSQKLMDTMMPMAGAANFYMQLVQNQKDPAYYGDIVTPEDADRVLMRWKVSDNEYRVIFGSLYAETVTADVLAELEKNPPQ